MGKNSLVFLNTVDGFVDLKLLRRQKCNFSYNTTAQAVLFVLNLFDFTFTADKSPEMSINDISLIFHFSLKKLDSKRTSKDHESPKTSKHSLFLSSHSVSFLAAT